MTISKQALLLSQKNVMLSESSIALFLATVRVICNEHFQADDNIVNKVDNLARRLIQENEQDIVEKLMPLCAKLINEEDMPGK